MSTARSMAAALGIAAALAGCGKPAGGGRQGAAAPSEAEAKTILAKLPAAYQSADLDDGRTEFQLCRSCHTIAEGGGNLVGPALHGVYGRKAGSVAGFAYSDPVKNAGFSWDAEHLDKWLTDPRADLPGTKMTFVGIKDDKSRRDLIGYLAVASSSGFQ